ncbi:hypothetical protein D3C81_1854430 [compost metagenome]
MGPVTKRLVAVMMTSLSPAARCLASNSRPLGSTMGSTQSRMKSRCHSSSCAMSVVARISRQKFKYSVRSSLPAR